MGCSYSKVIEKQDSWSTSYPIHDTVRYEYVMVNAAGNHSIIYC